MTCVVVVRFPLVISWFGSITNSILHDFVWGEVSWMITNKSYSRVNRPYRVLVEVPDDDSYQYEVPDTNDMWGPPLSESDCPEMLVLKWRKSR